MDAVRHNVAMGRTLQRRTKAPVFDFDLDSLPVEDWVGMSEGERLLGASSGKKIGRRTLYFWTSVGCRVSWMPQPERFLLPSFTRNGRRYTTRKAYLWWLRMQQDTP